MLTLAEAGSGATGVVVASAALLSVTSTVKLVLLLRLCREVLLKLDPAKAPSLADAALLVLALNGRRNDALLQLLAELASSRETATQPPIDTVQPNEARKQALKAS